MLAFMSPVPLTSDPYTPSGASPVGTMSLAILPSSAPTTCRGQASLPSLMTATTKASKRPKLSLNTSDATTVFGKKSTSLRLETLSATSPTTLNTFSNGYTMESALPKPLSSRPPRLSLSTNISQVRPVTPEQSDDSPNSTTQNSATSSTRSISSSLLSDSPPREVPYKLSFNLPSILRNGPIPRPLNYKLFAKPMFPVAKKVSFRAPLTEDITNSKYTWSDLDLASSSSSISTLALPPPQVSLPTTSSDNENKSTTTISSTSSPSSSTSPSSATSPSDREHAHVGDKRESDDEHDQDSCPQTPIAGRRKRVRDWRWTISPNDETSISQSDEERDQI